MSLNELVNEIMAKVDGNGIDMNCLGISGLQEKIELHSDHDLSKHDERLL